VLFVTVFFYAVSFTLAMGHDEAVKAYEQNISALAIAAQFISGDGAGWVKIVSVILNIFRRDDRLLRRLSRLSRGHAGHRDEHPAPQNAGRKINESTVQRGIMLFAICWPGARLS
jgi:amino acid permease